MSRKSRSLPVSSKKPNSLRIIGGQWRGRKLLFPDLPGLRPTPDRVRETLFNWLTPIIHDARCLDLFTGSGALSLEALSRGARHATLIDQASKAISQLQLHLATLNCQSAQLVQANTLEWLTRISTNQVEPYDIIFIDPPFHQNLVELSCAAIAEKNLLRPKAMVYIEIEATTPLAIPSSWSVFRQIKAGQVTGYLCTNT